MFINVLGCTQKQTVQETGTVEIFCSIKNAGIIVSRTHESPWRIYVLDADRKLTYAYKKDSHMTWKDIELVHKAVSMTPYKTLTIWENDV